MAAKPDSSATAPRRSPARSQTNRGKLDLDPVVVRKARTLARRVGKPIVDLAQQHTTVSVERATLRLAGLQGADADGIPWVNRLLDAVRGDVGLEHGVALPVWDALVRGEAEDLSTLAAKAAAGSVRFRLPEGRDRTRAHAASRKQVGAGIRRVDAPPPRARAPRQAVRRPRPPAVDLPDRRHRRHLRGHAAGAAGRPRGRRRHRGDPLDRAVAARLRAARARPARASPAPTPRRRTSG